ncbi:RHS repeat-associated core domain-containing protein [[Kitasatospora] papulosa]|uniref:RHS repeat-associated core domain-containing protein n=1 Tax=[Kitasatospora] papulosa TaxID=1464011 RepID=UPI0036ADABE3
MLDVVGVGWPNVDEDAYRDMADALREFGDDADDDAYAAYQHIQKLLSSGQSESLAALDRHWSKVQGKHKDLAKAARLVAGALDRVADIIVARKIAAVAELADLCATVGVTLAFAPVTAGLSTLLAGAKIAATRIAFKRILKEMAEAAVSEIVATLTEPAVAAIENIVADLAVQTALNVAGVQNGYSADQTVQAGKQGLQLNSAGGAGGPGPFGNLDIDHDAHSAAGMHLAGVQINMREKTGGKLGKAKGHHGRAKGKDSLTAGLDTTIDSVVEKLGKALGDLGNHVGKTVPEGISKSSKTHKDTDHDIRAGLKSVSVKDADGTDGRGAPRDQPSRTKGSTRVKPASLDEVRDDPRRHAISLENKTCKNDPVDVATGEMTLPHTDLILPGALPLILRRTHLSQYRFGRWFGRSWASTVDERLELDARGGGAIWARDDGSVLVYPRLPAPDDAEGVLPVEGPRLPLSHVGQDNASTTYRISDPLSGICREFTGSPYYASPAYWLSEVEDRNHNGITFVRRGDGAPVRIVHDGGYEIRLRVEDERVAEFSLQTPEGPVTVCRYGYDPEGNLDAVYNSSDLALRFTYDSQARITSWTDRNDSTFRYVYDVQGRVGRTVGPDGILSSTFVYEELSGAGATGRTTRYTDSTGATSVFRMNEALQVFAEIDPLGATTSYAHNAAGQLLQRTDALGRSTVFERDEVGNLIALVAPDGVRSTAVYNDMNLPELVTERGGIRHRYLYDDRGNLLASIASAGTQTEYGYTQQGHLSSVRDASGAITQISTNAAGLPQQITRPDGATVTCERDAFGRITSVIDALGGLVRQNWSVEGKLTWRELPDGSREEWAWDGEGNLLSHTDRMGRVTTHTAGHFDRLQSTRTGEESCYEFTHDTELRLSEVRNAQGLVWTYAYDAAGRLVSETDFDGRTLRYERDALGSVVRRINAAGQSLTFDRDALGRVTRIGQSDGSASVFTHDATGRVVRIENAHCIILLERDSSGRVVTETVNGEPMTFAYDTLGRRVGRRTPSGAESSLGYNESGVASYAVGEHAFRFGHDRLGRETTRNIDLELELHQEWDSVGRLRHLSVTSKQGSVLERTYTYQADGVPTRIDDSLSGQRTFALDSASRVREVQADGWSEQYAYNAAGDQSHTALAARAPGQMSAGDRLYEGSRITRAGRNRYDYDEQGRVTRRRTTTMSGTALVWHFEWNAEDRLTDVHTPQGEHWRYLYDPLGRRFAKQRLTTDHQVAESTTYRWDGALVAEERTGRTALVWDYVGLQPLCQREFKFDQDQQEIDRRFFAIVTDLVGTPTELISADGSLAWRARSTAWGATQWNKNSIAYTPLRYPGQYFDPESGLHYNFNRYYDPELGRYLSPDPLGLTPAINHYAYVPNPLVLSDPLGLAGCTADPTWGGQVRWTLDEHGRPYEMNAIVTRNMLDEGTDARNTIIPPGYQAGVGQARGHMLANQLGGSGDEWKNLFTISQNPTNTPWMSMFEQQIYDAVRYDGEIVTYNVYLEYVNDDPESPPKSIQLEAFGHRKDANNKLLFDIGDIRPNPAHDEPRP